MVQFIASDEIRWFVLAGCVPGLSTRVVVRTRRCYVRGGASPRSVKDGRGTRGGKEYRTRLHGEVHSGLLGITIGDTAGQDAQERVDGRKQQRDAVLNRIVHRTSHGCRHIGV
eukprot:scaffold402_cov473-Pavlova_lutheri.AAC.3